MDPLAIAVSIGMTIHVTNRSAISIRVRIAIGLVGMAVCISIRMTVRGLLWDHKANKRFLKDLIGSLGVCVGSFILQNGGDVLASIFKNQFGATGMAVEEVGDIVDIAANGNKAGLGRIMRLDIGAREGRKDSRRHVCWLSRVVTLN